MPDSSTASERIPRRSARAALPVAPLTGLAIAAVMVVLSTFFAYRALQDGARTAAGVSQTLTLLRRVQSLLSDVKDAESAQRGYLLTGSESYLAPHTSAEARIPVDLAALIDLLPPNSSQATQAQALQGLLREKLDELRETIELRREGDLEGALRIVRTDRGKLAMDRIRTIMTDLQTEERAFLTRRQQASEAAINTSFRVTLAGGALLLCLIGAGALLAIRTHRERETEVWLRAGQASIAGQWLGERRLEHVADKVLAHIARVLDAPVATFHAVDRDQRLRRLAGFADGGPGADEGASGQGLLGQAAKENRVLHIKGVPSDYLQVSSSLGRARPRELLVAPMSSEGVVHAVIELGFFHSVEAADRELVARISEPVAIAVRSMRERERIDDLLAETQSQAEELQTQQEELRVSNEELEEQGRVLKDSQVRLEGQQSELEATNTQLEEQAQMLESQKESLTDSQNVLEAKAAELERSNQYKSEFLANMSHELRTPLNSTLILSKLLADNKGGNLTAEQVRFAETIASAGNDLLTLINDILDLSKIEAGKIEVAVEPVTVARVLDPLRRTFEPIAADKSLALAIEADADAPLRLQTDPQRLSQILRNLLSNALKFTAHGEVRLRVSRAGDDAVAFAVRDSGIGIAAHEQEAIFDAFRQADGSTHRRFGGTGLGLTISRDLARRLGGDVSVQSAPGTGSTFTLTLPLVQHAEAPPPVAEAQASTLPAIDRRGAASRSLPARPGAKLSAPAAVDDDRDRLSSSTRSILVIEDDKRFASILKDLVHEMGFQCVVTHTASDGLAAASDYRPSAVLLDMNLPDHSGLGVLDRLKRNPATRHIPVHIASVADFSREALELGAVGYDLKPVAREQLVDALEKLKARFAQSLRRILIVEDDTRQLESLRLLLEADGVEITGVERASDALEELRQKTYDCMVMDLNLPDLSGYELLEQMSASDAVSFPPVIVYTGRLLTPEEEQRLGRYSKSIIIKDARSPERLLDEVTLFLHQVEADLPPERQRMLREARSRDNALEGRRVLVVEDDVRNVFALTSVLEPKGVAIEIARNGREALDALERGASAGAPEIDLVLMDIMMPEMDGYAAMREIRKRAQWKKLPIIALTAKAMKDDQEKCLEAGANDYIAKPLDVEKLLSLVRVWMPK